MSIYREANPTPLPYSVFELGSHPDLGNDDCWTGTDHATLEAARAAFDGPAVNPSTVFILLEGDDGARLVRTNPDYQPEPIHNDWRHEQAMQAGMAFGCSGYNDIMGY